MVILTDFIRDDGLRPGAEPVDDEPLGAWPVLRRLIAATTVIEQPGLVLLTGRVMVVHQSVAHALADDAGIREFTAEPLPEHPDFRIVRGVGSALVAPLTRMLARGQVQVLVGTRALLGEGWDAPSVNALVLASFVGSYMLTNQMRGRAIRTDPADPDKIASIWHLVAIALDKRPLAPASIHMPGLMDYFELNRRFQTFVGLDVVQPVIENGLDRLRLPLVEARNDPVTGGTETTLKRRVLTSPDALEDGNETMRERRERLPSVAGRWQEAIEAGAMGRVVPSTTSAPLPGFAAFHLRNTLTSLLMSALSTFLIVAQFILPGLHPGQDWRAAGIMLTIAGLGGLLFAAPKLYRAAKLWICHLL